MGMLLSLFQSLKAEVSWFFSALTYASAAADAPPAETPAETARVEANDSSARDHASDDHSVTLASSLPSHADDAKPHAPSHGTDVGDFLHHVGADAAFDTDAAPQADQEGQLLASASLTTIAAVPDSVPAEPDTLSALNTLKLDSLDASKAVHNSSDDISFPLAPFGSSANIDFDDAVFSLAKGQGHGGGGPGGGGGFDEIIGPAPGLRFHLFFDQAQSNLPVGFQTQVENVARFLSANYNDNIIINVHIGYGEVAGFRVPASALGESITNTVLVGNYSDMRGYLLGDTTPGTFGDDGRATLPGSDPTGGGNFRVSSAEAKALGISTTFAVDGYIGLSSFKNIFDYDTSNGVGSNQYDFYSVVMHEMTEVMGRMLFVGENVDGTSNAYDPLDLFHFATGTSARTFVGSTPGYFSIDNGSTHLHDFNSSPNGDFGDWAGGQGVDSFDAFGGLGQVAPVGAFDLVVMDAIGWDRIA